MEKKIARFAILHVSDMHWIHPEAIKKLSVPSNAKRAARSHRLSKASIATLAKDITEAKRYYKEIMGVFEEEDLSAYLSNRKTILVHTGDSANFNWYHRHVSWKDQFASITNSKTGLLKILENKWKFDRKFAVPGNHDTRRLCELSRLKNKDQFREFKLAFKGWESPFDYREAPIEDEGTRLCILPINSCDKCGIKREGRLRKNIYDEIDIDVENIKKWAKSEPAASSQMRIALVHHNPLPNQGETARIAAKEVFVNNGDFNQSLITSNIKLVLSGHKHIGNEVYTAMPRYAYPNVNERGWAKPIIECGFLSVSAPTLLRSDKEVVRTGWYLIEIDIAAGENIALLTVTRFFYDIGQHKLTRESFPYRIALSRLNEFHLSEERQQSRISILDRVTRRIYSKSSEIPLERVLSLNPPLTPLANIMQEYRNRSRIRSENIFGIYSVSVMSPEAWWAYDLRDSFTEIYLEFIRRRRDFPAARIPSNSLKHAFKTATENAMIVKKAVQNHSEYGVSAAAFYEGIKSDLLPWLYKGSYSPFSGSFTVIPMSSHENNETPWDIPWDCQANFPDSLSGIFEIARFLFWDAGSFESEYALSVIKFHEQFGVPLFWINPDNLIGRAGQKRKQIGIFSICSFEELRGQAVRPCYVPCIFPVNGSGEYPSDKEFFDISSNAYQSHFLTERLWNGGNEPSFLTNISQPQLGEFAGLLRRPDLFLAVDAWFLQNARHNKQTEHIAFTKLSGFDKTSQCTEWSSRNQLA